MRRILAQKTPQSKDASCLYTDTYNFDIFDTCRLPEAASHPCGTPWAARESLAPDAIRTKNPNPAMTNLRTVNTAAKRFQMKQLPHRSYKEPSDVMLRDQHTILDFY
jgi:hypothetical protein